MENPVTVIEGPCMKRKFIWSTIFLSLLLCGYSLKYSIIDTLANNIIGSFVASDLNDRIITLCTDCLISPAEAARMRGVHGATEELLDSCMKSTMDGKIMDGIHYSRYSEQIAKAANRLVMAKDISMGDSLYTILKAEAYSSLLNLWSDCDSLAMDWYDQRTAFLPVFLLTYKWILLAYACLAFGLLCWAWFKADTKQYFHSFGNMLLVSGIITVVFGYFASTATASFTNRYVGRTITFLPWWFLGIGLAYATVGSFVKKCKAE